MKDLEMLNKLVEDLMNGEGAKIDINIPVCGQAFFECVKLNEKMCKQKMSDIRFREFCHPHISLKMGQISSVEDLEKIFQILDKYFAGVRGGGVSALPLILKKPAEEYYFCEVDDARFIDMSSQLDKLLCDLMLPPKHPLGKDNLHHITIGYRTEGMKVCQSVLGETIPPFSFDRVCVSLVGEHGVCLGAVKTFFLREKCGHKKVEKKIG